MRADALRICIFMGRYSVGGHATLTKEYLRSFQEKGFHVDLVAGPPQKGEAELRNFPKATMIQFYRRNIHPLYDAIALFEFAYHLIKTRPHILLTETAKAGFIGRLAGFLLCIPLRIQMFQGHTLTDFFGGFASKIFQTMEQIAAYWCDGIILPKKSDIPLFCETLKIASRPGFFHVPRIPLDFATIDPDQKNHSHQSVNLRTTLGLGADTLIFATLARLAKIKRIDWVIRSFHHLADTNSCLIIPGDGPEYPHLKALTHELNLTNSVHFIGTIDQPGAFLSECDIFVHPSLHEGHGIVTIQALLLGKFVVASTQGLITDVPCANKRLLDTCTSTSDWAEAMKQAAHIHRTNQIGPVDDASRFCQKIFSRKAADYDLLMIMQRLAKRKGQQSISQALGEAIAHHDMKPPPLEPLSVVIPFYQVKPTWLYACVNSLINLAKRYDEREFHIWIVDDCSPMPLPDLTTIRSISGSNVVWHISRNNNNLGLAGTRNVALNKIPYHHWVHFLDADDIMIHLPEFGDSPVVVGKHVYFGANETIEPNHFSQEKSSEPYNNKKDLRKYPIKHFLDRLLLRNMHPVSTFFVRRDAIGKLLFREDLDSCEDWHFWIELFTDLVRYHDDCTVSSEVVTAIRKSATSMSAEATRIYRARKNMFDFYTDQGGFLGAVSRTNVDLSNCLYPDLPPEVNTRWARWRLFVSYSQLLWACIWHRKINQNLFTHMALLSMTLFSPSKVRQILASRYHRRSQVHLS